MLQLCVCRDIEHLGSLESTKEARVARGATPIFPSPQYVDIRTAEAWTMFYNIVIIFVPHSYVFALKLRESLLKSLKSLKKIVKSKLRGRKTVQ